MSARTQCPECHRFHVQDVNATLFAREVDFFLCPDCQHLYHVPKGQDGPASQALLGDAKAWVATTN
jgi:hypothetical protein